MGLQEEVDQLTQSKHHTTHTTMGLQEEVYQFTQSKLHTSLWGYRKK